MRAREDKRGLKTDKMAASPPNQMVTRTLDHQSRSHGKKMVAIIE
jgi:hypothetical protein